MMGASSNRCTHSFLYNIQQERSTGQRNPKEALHAYKKTALERERNTASNRKCLNLTSFVQKMIIFAHLNKIIRNILIRLWHCNVVL